MKSIIKTKKMEGSQQESKDLNRKEKEERRKK